MRDARLIRSACPFDLHKPSTGLQKAKGFVQGRRLLTTPLSKQPAAFYEIVIEQERRGHKGNKHWDTIRTERKADPDLSLSFEDVRIPLNLAEAKLVFSQSRLKRFEASTCEPGAESAVYEYLASQHIQAPQGVLSKDIRLTEKIIQSGDPLLLIGDRIRTADGGVALGKGKSQFFLASQLSEIFLEEKASQSAFLFFIISAGAFCIALIIFIHYQWTKNRSSRVRVSTPPKVIRKPQPSQAVDALRYSPPITKPVELSEYKIDIPGREKKS